MRRRSDIVIVAVFAATLLLVVDEGAAQTQVFELSVHNGELPVEQRVLRVRQGDDVTLRWTTDEALTLHLHGYDIEQRLTPHKPVQMRFTAGATGRFPIESHAHGRGGERTLAHVEVHPR
jgi:FtsP/CotA-like multicopper oxidase with cupredoxin domain